MQVNHPVQSISQKSQIILNCCYDYQGYNYLYSDSPMISHLKENRARDVVEQILALYEALSFEIQHFTKKGLLTQDFEGEVGFWTLFSVSQSPIFFLLMYMLVFPIGAWLKTYPLSVT